MSDDLSNLSAETLLRLYERLEARVADLEADMEDLKAALMGDEPEDGPIEFYMDGKPVSQ